MYFNFRLWAFTRGARLRIAYAVAVGLATAAAGIARLALLGVLLAGILQGESLGDLIPLIVAAAGMVLLRSALQYHKEMVAHKTAAAVQLRLRRNLYGQVLHLGPAYFNQQRTGDAMLSLVDGVEQLETFFGQYLPQLFTAALTPIGIFIFMAFLDLPTALVALAFALFTLLAPSAFHKWNKSSSMRRREAYGSFGAEFLDSIQGLFTLKSFGQGKARGQMLAARAHEVFRTTMWVLASNAGSLGVTVGGIAIGAAAMLAVGAARVTAGDMELAALLIILMLGIEVFRPLRELSQLFHQGMVGLSAAHGIFALQDARPVVRETPRPATEDVPLEPSVTFENVSFSYPGTRRAALTNLSFDASPGDSVGIVGESGSGKTTIVRLLLRFYDTSGGRVLLGGRDARDLSFDQLRRHIAVVSQDTYLFHGTVAENLKFGKPSATDSELEEAARAANAHEFITRLPQGYDTVVGERGVRLSGGQRQRIAIARALLRDAPILVLDEALSAVDSENEHTIQEALDRLMQGRTTLVIAHRLSSVRNADRILVLKDGELVETGRHEDLLAAGGAYSRLMAEQAVEADHAESVVQFNGAAPAETILADRPEHVASEEAEAAPTDAILKAEGMGWLTTFTVLLGLIKPWWLELVISFVLGVSRFVTLIGVGVVSALIVASVRNGEPYGGLLITLFILAPLSAVLHWAESWVSHDMAFRLLSEMRIALFQKLDDLAPAYLLRRRTGDLVSMATQDVETIEYFFAHTVAPAFVAVVVPAGVLITLFIFGWPMALALLPFLLAVSISPVLARNRVDRLGSRSREELGELNAHVVDTLQGLNEVAAFQRGNHRLNEFMGQSERYVGVRVPFFRELTFQRVFLEAGVGFGGLAVAVTGGTLVANGSLDPGMLPLLTLISMAAFLPMSELANIGRLLADTLGSTRRVYAVHLEPVPLQDGPGVRVDGPAGAPQGIEARGVEFSYDYTKRPALSDITFSVPPGKTVALVGPSGAGKTTAAHLMMRFWDPAAGRVLLGGHDLREYTLDDLRQRIALVAQDTYLFNTSLRDNLLMAKPGASDDELHSAVEMAGLKEFVESLPEGLDTPVGERGAQLSGGQRQRVAIGRAFLKDAPILVLDEATSHLDATNERLVRRAMDRLMEERTTLVIAHRLSTVRDANQIVVLDDGRVVESGTHDELLARGGLYAQLVARQVNGTGPAAVDAVPAAERPAQA
ncbi:MAG: thiol reductant ABC exporter subunit CydC [Dehalococcoidia bacterium]